MQILFDDFIKQLKSGEIRIDFNHLYDDLEEPLTYILDDLKQKKKDAEHMHEFYTKKLSTITVEKEREGYEKMKELTKYIYTREHIDDNEDTLEKYLLYYNGFEGLRFHSGINGKENGVMLKDGIMSFVEFEYPSSNILASKRIIKPIKFDEDFKKPKSIKINIPSKKLVFTNFFRTEVH